MQAVLRLDPRLALRPRYSVLPTPLSPFKGGPLTDDPEPLSLVVQIRDRNLEGNSLYLLRQLFNSIRDSLAGYCYAQLQDVQECNGLLDENRQPKLPVEALREACIWQS